MNMHNETTSLYKALYISIKGQALCKYSRKSTCIIVIKAELENIRLCYTGSIDKSIC